MRKLVKLKEGWQTNIAITVWQRKVYEFVGLLEVGWASVINYAGFC
jgi:hypothetical protein